MVSGNPPRHSKSTEGPVTIDLDAQEIASANRYRKRRSAPRRPGGVACSPGTDAQQIADRDCCPGSTDRSTQDAAPPHISSTYTADEPPLDQPVVPKVARHPAIHPG